MLSGVNRVVATAMGLSLGSPSTSHMWIPFNLVEPDVTASTFSLLSGGSYVVLCNVVVIVDLTCYNIRPSS